MAESTPGYELPKHFLDHLRGQFERALPVLFTGAGFSLDAIGISGRPIPSASQLTKEIWELCFPGQVFDPETTLPDLFDNALLRQRAALDAHLRSRFKIREDGLKPWHEVTFSFPWHRVYTLNIDDAADVAGRQFRLPRPIRSVSAYADQAHSEPFDAATQLQVVHLNGRVEDGPANLTFSTVQYAERLSRSDAWYLGLLSEILTRPFVFIGTSLNEPSLWQYIELRQGRGSRAMRELRSRSYLVTPQLPIAKQALLAEYYVEWIPLTGQQFAEQVLAKLVPARDTGNAYLASLRSVSSNSREKLDEVGALASKPVLGTEYLLGQEPQWSDIQSGRAITRGCDNAILTAADRSLRLPPTSTRPLLLISGTNGSGKSSSLMRVALTLNANGIRVAWLDRSSSIALRNVRELMRKPNAPHALAIDDADMYGTELASLVKDVVTGDQHPLVIVAVRSTRVDRVLNPTFLNPVAIEEVTMPPLEDRDIEGLIDVLDRDNRLGVLKGKARAEQISMFREHASRQLLVAMIEVTSGRRFEDKVGAEFESLEVAGQLVYALVSVASAFRYGLARDEILLAAGVDASNAVLNAIDLLSRRHIITIGEDGLLRARHRVIAEVTVEQLRVQGKLQDVLFGLASVLAVKCNSNASRGTKASRFLRQIINHDYLARSVGHEQSRNFFGKLESLLSWDFHYWLQRGSLELEIGLVSLAENFLNQAMSLASDDPFVRTEYAYLLLRKASEAPGRLDAQKLVDDALTILHNLIAARGKIDSYPYHVLGAQGLSWARRGIVDPVEKARFLRSLVEAVTEGTRHHKSRTELVTLLADLQKELLSMAVRT